ncbi:transposase [Candidatus Daviesbacteria bacterium]|nr:transposase [Candidatus Daviesbacteria bacterium]
MPQRFLPLVTNQFYHIFNRGTEKRTIFESSRDYNRLIKSMSYYQIQGPKPSFSKFFQPKTLNIDFSKKIVDILVYCFMPNHFHLLIKQVKDGGLSEFMSKVSNSYTKYYNTKYDRVGPLLQGEFKAVLIESDEQLVHVSRYIHLNPLVSNLVKELLDYPWSSYKEYINNTTGVCSKDEILSFFRSFKDYQDFILDHASYAQELEFIKHKLIED